MSFKNPWVGYLERGYFQIKQKLLNKLRTSNPEITDYSESNVFVILISIFAGLTEQLNYYIDQLLRESFLPTARRYSSVVRLVRLIDYRIKAANPASTDLKVTLLDLDENPYELSYGEGETIPMGTRIEIQGMDFYTTRDLVINYPHKEGWVPVAQYTKHQESHNFSSVEPGSVYPLGNDYIHDSCSVIIETQTWERVDTFAMSKADDKHYIVDIKEDGIAYIEFGDGEKGQLPNNGDSATISWRSTNGKSGNLSSGAVDIIDTKFGDDGDLTYANKINIVNPNRFTGGTLFEGIEEIRRNAPLSLRTLNRAVTRQDYIDVAKMHAGVDKANVSYDCGKFVTIYVSPQGGGTASLALLDSVETWFEKFRMITTFVDIKSVGEADLNLDVTVTGKLHMKVADIENQVKTALLEEYNYRKADVGKAVRMSNIWATIDNQSQVKFAHINKLYTIPYFFPSNHNTELNKNFTLKGTNIKRTYTLIFNSGTSWQLFEGPFLEAELTTGTEYENDYFKLTPEAGAYTSDNRWVFSVYPANKDIEITPNSIATLKEENLTLTIKETLS